MIDHRLAKYLRLAMHVKYYRRHFLIFLTGAADALVQDELQLLAEPAVEQTSDERLRSVAGAVQALPAPKSALD
jgi:hypothetical protein